MTEQCKHCSLPSTREALAAFGYSQAEENSYTFEKDVESLNADLTFQLKITCNVGDSYTGWITLLSHGSFITSAAQARHERLDRVLVRLMVARLDLIKLFGDEERERLLNEIADRKDLDDSFQYHMLPIEQLRMIVGEDN